MTPTRTRILEEASRQLAGRTYERFTVASVRDALGLSSGSMFHAFPSKAALAAAVYVAGMADYQRTTTTVIARAKDPEQSLRSFIRAHLGWVEDHRGLARFLFSTLPDEVLMEATAPLADHNAAFYAALDAFYAQLIAAGLLAPLERPVAHAICIGPVQEYCRQWVRGNAPKPPRRVSATLEDASLAGLASTLATKTPRTRAKENSP
jgi:AcrR family transcriptional regulator